MSPSFTCTRTSSGRSTSFLARSRMRGERSGFIAGLRRSGGCARRRALAHRNARQPDAEPEKGEAPEEEPGERVPEALRARHAHAARGQRGGPEIDAERRAARPADERAQAVRRVVLAAL